MICESGMDRFFKPTSLALYRKLVDGQIAAVERSWALKVLAKEWDAFARACRMPSIERATPLPEQVELRSQG
jgi:hypothetical protein